METKRHYFIAVELPLLFKSYLKQQVSTWNQLAQFKQVVDYQDYHLTLCFLGTTDKIELIINLLQNFIKDKECFTLNFQSVQTFGVNERPRILWVGNETSVYLEKIQEELTKLLEKEEIKINSATSFQPHVTIAKRWSGKAEFNKEECTFEKKEVRIERITLYETRMDSIPKYHVVKSFMLNGDKRGK